VQCATRPVTHVGNSPAHPRPLSPPSTSPSPFPVPLSALLFTAGRKCAAAPRCWGSADLLWQRQRKYRAAAGFVLASPCEFPLSNHVPNAVQKLFTTTSSRIKNTQQLRRQPPFHTAQRFLTACVSPAAVRRRPGPLPPPLPPAPGSGSGHRDAARWRPPPAGAQRRQRRRWPGAASCPTTAPPPPDAVHRAPDANKMKKMKWEDPCSPERIPTRHITVYLRNRLDASRPAQRPFKTRWEIPL